MQPNICLNNYRMTFYGCSTIKLSTNDISVALELSLNLYGVQNCHYILSQLTASTTIIHLTVE